MHPNAECYVRYAAFRAILIQWARTVNYVVVIRGFLPGSLCCGLWLLNPMQYFGLPQVNP